MVTLNGKPILMEQFSNGETKVKDFDVLPSQNILEFKYTTDADLITLMFVKLRIDELKASCTLFIWYMPYSRMDRKIEGDLFTLQYACWLINTLNFAKVVVMEPHSEKTMQLLERATDIYPVMDWLPQVMQQIGFSEKDHIVFPDKGASARYQNSGYENILVFEKKRNPTTGRIEDMQLKEGTVNPGAKCIIIDDLCSKGGTFAWAGSILKSLGASEVILIVSHCEESIFEGKLLTSESPVSNVFTSTSMMCKQHENLNYMKVEVKNYV